MLDPMYGPVIDGTMIKDHLIYLVRQGNIRPNTPIVQTYAKDDAWGFNYDSYKNMRDKYVPNLAQQIKAAQESTNLIAPAPWQDRMFEAIFPNHSDQIKSIFGCPADAYDGDDCQEQFGRFIQAQTWYCNTRWAYNGELKNNPQNY